MVDPASKTPPIAPVAMPVPTAAGAGAEDPPPRPLRPLDRFAPELLLRAQGIRLAIFDVDGVLTDGRIAIAAEGETVKSFSTLDGHGLKLLARAGIVPAVITGRDSAAVRRRLADLGIVHAAFGVGDKLAAAATLRAAVGAACPDPASGTGPVPWAAIAAMGDDWPDLPLLLRAAFAVAPPGAHPDVLQAAHHVTRAAAGHGAARECCDLLITATGHYAGLLAGHLATLDGSALPSGR